MNKVTILSVEPGWDRKYTTPTNSPQQVQKELHAEDTPHSTAKLLPSKNNTAQIWRNKNQDSKPDIDTNNLAN